MVTSGEKEENSDQGTSLWSTGNVLFFFIWVMVAWIYPISYNSLGYTLKIVQFLHICIIMHICIYVCILHICINLGINLTLRINLFYI